MVRFPARRHNTQFTIPNSMNLELLSILVAAILVGPGVTQMARHFAAAKPLINLIALLIIGALTLVLIIPEAYIDGGWPTLVFVAAGFLLPLGLHRIGHLNFGADSVLIAGVAIHVLMESAAVAISPDPDHLGWAVAAHRLPVGLAIFLLAPTPKAGWLVIALLVGITIIGFTGVQWLPSFLSSTQEAWLEGFVAGSLFHIIHGHHHHDSQEHKH